MSEVFTAEKIKQLLNLPEDQREDTLDRIFNRYLDVLIEDMSKLPRIQPKWIATVLTTMENVEGILKKFGVDAGSMQTIMFLKKLLLQDILDIAWILTFGSKPEHREKLSCLWGGLGKLIYESPQEEKKV